MKGRGEREGGETRRIDRRQLRTLLKYSLKMDFRTSASKFMKGKDSDFAFIWTVLLPDFVMGLLLGAGLFKKADLGAYSLILLAMVMTLAAMGLLVDFHETIANPLDAEILGPLPVSPRTRFLARLANLLFYASLICLSFTFLPALFGAGIKGSGPLFIPFFLLVSLTAVLAGAAFVVLFFDILARRVGRERLKTFLAYIQLGLLFFTFMGYQFIPRLLDKLPREGLHLSFHKFWSFLVPPAWFAGLLAGIMEGFDTAKAIHAVLALGCLLLLWGLAAGKITVEEGDAPRKAGKIRSIEKTGKPGKNSPLGAFLARPGPEKAGFFLAARYFQRDQKARVSLLWGFLLSLTFPLLFILDGEFQDPFTPKASFPTFAMLAELSLPGLLVPFALESTEDWKASWIFWTSPLEEPAAVFRGALKLVLARYFMPFFLLFFLALCFLLPLRHAFPVALLNFLFSLDLAAFATLFKKTHPFSRENRKNQASAGLALVVFASMILIAFSGAAQHFLYRNPKFLPAGAAFSALLFFFLRFLADLRMENALEEAEY